MAKNVIYVGPADGANHKPLNLEGRAIGGAITPGTILKSVATGFSVSDIGATVFGEITLVADKDQQRTKLVTDGWTVNENMVAIQPRSGDFMNVLVATGQTIATVGTPLARNGAGLLKIAVTPATVGTSSEEIVAFSDEIITTTATTLARVRFA